MESIQNLRIPRGIKKRTWSKGVPTLVQKACYQLGMLVTPKLRKALTD